MDTVHAAHPTILEHLMNFLNRNLDIIAALAIMTSVIVAGVNNVPNVDEAAASYALAIVENLPANPTVKMVEVSAPRPQQYLASVR